MDGENEQRVAIKFCFKADISATETIVLVQKSYGNESSIKKIIIPKTLGPHCVRPLKLPLRKQAGCLHRATSLT
jgi:hypothetical protein